jgi:hypothetical protein
MPWFHDAFVIYAGLRMFSIGPYLFDPEDFDFLQTFVDGKKSLFQRMMEADRVNVELGTFGDGPALMMSIVAHMSNGNAVGVAMRVDEIPLCNQALRTVQRRVRARAAARREAIAMALHPRLGVESALGVLGADLLHLILK